VKAKVFTKLFFRHWDEWVEDKRQHLFVMLASGGEPKDVTPGDRDAFPTSDTFSTGDNFTFSPDSTHLVFTAVPEKNEAWSTNYDICRVPITGGTLNWECLTKDNPGADSGPVFSPDGKHLAYRAQKRAGFEADRWELMIVNTDARGTFTSKPSSVTPRLDRWVEEFVWLADSQNLLVVVEDRASKVLYKIGIEAPNFPWKSLDPPGSTSLTLQLGSVSAPSVSRDGKWIAYAKASLTAPTEVYVEASDGKGEPVNVSRANAALLDQLDLPRPSPLLVNLGADLLHMWILSPPGFDVQKKWPLVYLVHGGPQGAWEDGWSFRWNAELWAAQGYIVALPNPRGSTGFGQRFIDEISGD